jgi:hypothetical protein
MRLILVKRAALNLLVALAEKTKPAKASFLGICDQYFHVAGGHGTRDK